MNRILKIAMLALAFPLSLLAHGNMDHILGTVTKFTGTTISVSKDGHITEVICNDKTTWEEGGKASSSSALHVGDRVVIHAMKMEGKEIAHEVRFSHPVK